MFMYVEVFNENAFNQGVQEIEEHYRLVDRGQKSEQPLPPCPYPVGSDAAGSWKAGLYFGLPID